MHWELLISVISPAQFKKSGKNISTEAERRTRVSKQITSSQQIRSGKLFACKY